MGPYVRVVAAALIAYAIGSIPWAVIVVRVFWRQDIRTLGSGNTGATNVLRVFGTAPGVVVLLLDAAKGVLGVYVAGLLAPPQWGLAGHDWSMVIGAVMTIAGHSFSPFIGFRGGKGVATAAGAIVLLAPKVIPIVLVIFIAMVAVSRYVSLGSVVIAALFPVVSWLVYPQRYGLIVFAIAVGVFVIVRHRSNIVRLKRGQESKITFRRRVWDDLKSRGRDGSA